MSENTPEVVSPAPSDPNVYVENPDFVPDPMDVTGTLETSGTAGSEESKVENTTPVFAAADALSAEAAKEAVQDGSNEGVVLPEGENPARSTEDAKDAVVAKAEEVEKEPVKVVDPSITNAEKNKESGKSTDPAKVEASQKAAAPSGDNKSGNRTKANPTA